MSKLIDKVKEEFYKLYEKVSVDPSDDDKEAVKIKVDNSDEGNVTYKENQNPFSLFNTLRIEVEVEEEEDSPYIDNLKEAIKKVK
jgi:activator of HSP90 ATPase